VSAALHGNLKDFGIAEVFQLIGQQRKTGLLEISGEDHRVQLAFDQGAVVWASPVGRTEFAVLGERLVRCGLITRANLEEMVRQSEASARSLPSLLVSSASVGESDLEEIQDLLSRETIFEVMRWTGGSFHFTAQPIHHDVPPDKLLAAEQILMDGLRMLDEWQTFQNLVPSDDTVFERSGRLDVYKQQFQGDVRGHMAQLERIYQLVDGRLTARRIIDLSRLGTFDATRILAELHTARLIQPVAAKRTLGLNKRPRQSIPVMQYVRSTLAALVPLCVLAAVVFYGQQRQQNIATGLHGNSIRNRPLEAARQDFARLRLHNAIEASRFMTGSWPEEATVPDSLGATLGLAMAPETAQAYYYARREGGIVLLPPRR
jgi:hypothetical protein